MVISALGLIMAAIMFGVEPDAWPKIALSALMADAIGLGVVFAAELVVAPIRIDRELRAELSTAQARLIESDTPRLVVSGLSVIEANYKTFHWILSIRNASRTPAENVRLELQGIEPLPNAVAQSTVDFPYAVPPHPPERTVERLGREETQRFDLFRYYLTGQYDPLTGRMSELPGQVFVVGVFTHGVHLGTGFSAQEGESWRLQYWVRCANAEPHMVAIHAAVENNELRCRLIGVIT